MPDRGAVEQRLNDSGGASPAVISQRLSPDPATDTEAAAPSRWRQAPLRVLRAHWPVAVVALLVVIASLVLRRAYFPFGYSGDADEGAYVLQAQTFLSGHITLPAHVFSGALRPWLTGEADHRIFTQYFPAWPAAMAASQALTGTMLFAPLLSAVGWIVAVYALTLQLFHRKAAAITAAALLGASPILLLHSILYLPYGFTAALLTGALALLLAGLRSGGKAVLLAAGVCAGIALATRPFDVVLFGLPCLFFVLAVQRRQLRGVVKPFGWFAVGTLPFIALIIAFDVALTGHWLQTPLLAGDPLNRFGFGPRRVMPGEPPVDYGVSQAVVAIRANLHGMPSWLPGGALLAGLAAGGAVLRPDRAKRLLLVAIAAAFPIGYFFWWGTALSAHGAVDGIGPHYYLPAFGPVVILAADVVVRGAAAARQRLGAKGTTALAAAFLVAGWFLTATAVTSKIHVEQAVNASYRQVQKLLPRSVTASRIVMISAPTPSNFVGKPYPFLLNEHGTSARVLYAADLGVDAYQLGLRFPSREIFRVRPVLSAPPGVAAMGGAATRLQTIQAPSVCVDATLRLLAPKSHLVGYLISDGQVRQRVTTQAGTPATQAHQRWLLSTGDLARGPQYLTVGFAAAGFNAHAERWEQRISAGPVVTGVAAQWPGFGWQQTLQSGRPVWQEISPAGVINVTVAGGNCQSA